MGEAAITRSGLGRGEIMGRKKRELDGKVEQGWIKSP